MVKTHKQNLQEKMTDSLIGRGVVLLTVAEAAVLSAFLCIFTWVRSRDDRKGLIPEL